MSSGYFVHVYCLDRAFTTFHTNMFLKCFLLPPFLLLPLLPSSLQLGLPPCVDKELFKNGLVEGKQEPES